MGETVYVRSCRHCGFGCDSKSQDMAERARDAHETICSQNPDNQK